MEKSNVQSLSCPWSLPSDIYDPYAFDLAHYTQLLDDNAKRLFVEAASFKVKIVELGGQDVVLDSESRLESYLQSSNFGGTRIILVPQRFSWDHLMISEQGFQQLLHHFRVFPAVVDLVQAFGQQISSENETVSIQHSQVRGLVSEYCYLVKHVEEHGREESGDPWSIRQMGIYHQKDESRNADIFIVFNPSKTFQKRLRDAQSLLGRQPTWTDIHIFATSGSAITWRQYISYLEAKLVRLKTKAHLSEVSEQDILETRPKLRIEFDDSQDIQVVHDKLHVVSYLVETNIKTFATLSSLQSKQLPQSGETSTPSDRHATFTMTLAFNIAELETQSQRLKSLIQRVTAASDLMQNIMDFRSLEALKTSSSMSTKISKLAQSDNKLMLEDARTLKTITILTMIYLPASFVSQFLSMGYIGLNYAQHHVSLHFSSEMWIFGILTIILLVVTIGCWLLLDWRRSRSAAHGATSLV